MAISGNYSRDLWNLALATLKIDDKQQLNFGLPSQRIIEDVLIVVEEKRNVCMQKRWKYKKANGDVLILRDIFEKIVTWVSKFKEVGDAAVQYDPSHAALPWAAVRFFLQMAINDVSIFGTMAEGLERVSNLVVRSRIFEIVYLTEASAAKSHLEEALVRLYVAILTYLANARRYYEKRTIQRIGQSIIQTSDTVDSFLQRIAEEQNMVEYWGKLVDAERQRDIATAVSSTHGTINTISNDMQELSLRNDTSRKLIETKLEQILDTLRQPIVRIIDQVSELHDNLKREERLEVFRWMSTIPYREHHKNSWKEVLHDSGAWVQLKEEYIEWKGSSASSILWLHGIPGSGKTKLVSTIVETFLTEKRKYPSSPPVAYFYCARNAAEAKRADPGEVLRAVVKQLSCSDSDMPIRDPVLQEYQLRRKEAEEDGSEPAKLTIEDCTEIILDLTDQNPAIIIIDALDECDPLRRHELLSALKLIIDKSASLIKVLISSRDDMDIVLRLAGLPNIFIKADENKEDIDRFIYLEVEQAIRNKRLLNGRVPEELKDYIITKLINGAHGMFQWASLQIQNLCDPRRMRLDADVRKALDRPPKALSALYTAVYAQILQLESEGRSIAENALKWLLCAQRPLSTSEFLSAVSSHSIAESSQLISSEEILGLCCNLVVLDTELDTFRLAHLSVREYLEGRSDYSFDAIHSLAVERCLNVYASKFTAVSFSTQISERAVPQISLEENTILWEYATLYWVVHYGKIRPDQRRDTIKLKVMGVFFRGAYDSGPFFEWIHSISKLSSAIDIRDPLADKFAAILSSPVTPLHTLCTFGLLEILEEESVLNLIDLHQTSNEGETGLFLAAWQGHVDIIGFLVNKNVNVRKINNNGETALHQAACSGHVGVLRLLLENGADLKESDDSGWTSLDWAIKGRHMEAVLFLIENGAREEARAKYGDELLDWASTRLSVTSTRSGDRISKIQARDFNSYLSRPTGYTGIHNEGQTGYLNTTLQLLFILRPIHEALFQPAIWSRPSFIPALKRVFAHLKTSEEAISARDLTRAFGWEEQQLSEPQDPLQFLEVLLSRLDDLLKENQGISIQDLFCTTFRYRKYLNAELSWVIHLSDYGIKNAIEAFRSRLVDESVYVETLPPVLVLYLTRIYYDVNKDQMEKAHDRIEFSPTMTIEEQHGAETRSRRYILHGVVVNHGGKEGAKAYVFLKPQKDGGWIKFRNEQVVFATSKEAIEDNFGNDIRPARIATSCTAQGLLYLEDCMLDRLLGPTDDIDMARCLLPNVDEIDSEPDPDDIIWSW